MAGRAVDSSRSDAAADFLDCQHFDDHPNLNDFLTPMNFAVVTTENLRNYQSWNWRNSVVMNRTVFVAAAAVPSWDFVMHHHCKEYLHRLPMGMDTDMVAHKMANSKQLYLDRSLVLMLIAVDKHRRPFPVSRALMDRCFDLLADFQALTVSLDISAAHWRSLVVMCRMDMGNQEEVSSDEFGLDNY